MGVEETRDTSTPAQSSISVEDFGRMGAGSRGKKNGPTLAPTSAGPNPTPVLEVGLMPTIVDESTDSPEDRLRKWAIVFLEKTREQGEAFRRNRVIYASLARSYGLTNQQIADTLGLTEGRVRQIIADGDL